MARADLTGACTLPTLRTSIAHICWLLCSIHQAKFCFAMCKCGHTVFEFTHERMCSWKASATRLRKRRMMRKPQRSIGRYSVKGLRSCLKILLLKLMASKATLQTERVNCAL